jgi:hypothetical protein
MDGVADMGGTGGWGPVQPPSPDEPVFAEDWRVGRSRSPCCPWAGSPGGTWTRSGTPWSGWTAPPT